MQQALTVTVQRDEDIEELKTLIAAVRKVLTSDQLTILEAPRDMDFPYPFPVVKVDGGPHQGRHFGAEAVDLLRSISRG